MKLKRSDYSVTWCSFMTISESVKRLCSGTQRTYIANAVTA